MNDKDTDSRVTSARALLAEQHQPAAMTHAEVRALLARYQRRLHDLAGLAEGWPAGGYQPIILQALRDAIAYQQLRALNRSASQIGLYRSVARAMGIERRMPGWTAEASS